jgi:hypothetical protein
MTIHLEAYQSEIILLFGATDASPCLKFVLNFESWDFG